MHEHLGNGLRQEYLSGAGGRFRLFQHQNGFVCPVGIGKDADHVLLLQDGQRLFGDALQFLVDVDVSLAGADALRGNIHAIPGETEDLPDAHGAGERQIDGQFQPFVLA